MHVFNQVAILFLLIIIGYTARKTKLLADEGIQHLSSFVLNISLPALILSALQKPFSSDLLGQSFVMLLLGFAMYGLGFIVAALYSRITRLPFGKRGVHEYAIIFSNVGFMGYPVIESVLGKDALFHLAIFNVPFNLLAFSIGVWLLARGSERPVSLSWKTFVNPAVVATVVGFAAFLLSWTFPKPLGMAFEMTGAATSPLSMIVIGAVLARSSIRQVLSSWRNYLTVFVRLIVFPFLFFGLLYLLGLRGILLVLPVMVSTMPAAANTTLMATIYGADEKSASSIVFLSTLFCVLSIPLAALALRSFMP